MKTGFIVTVASLILTALTVSCAPVQKTPAPVGNTSTFPMELTDQAGRTVRIEKLPQKIISLAPGNTEIVYALGLEDLLVGVTEYCNYPEAALSKPKIGGFSTVDIEKIVAIQPDLVLAANIHKDKIIPGLERLGMTVLTITPHNMDEVLAAIRMIGRATACEEAAAGLIAGMEKRIRAVTDKTALLTEKQHPRVFYIVWHNPLMTVGQKTRFTGLIKLAGGTSISQELTEDYPTISLESVLMADPEVIIVGGGHGTGADAPLVYALAEPRLAGTAARQTNRVFMINGDLTSREGPRIVEGLEQMAKMIHPEIFGKD